MDLKRNNLLKMSVIAFALCSSIGVQAQNARSVNTDGYLTDSWGQVVKTATGLCVRTSSYSAATSFHPDCDKVVKEEVVTLPAPKVEVVEEKPRVPYIPSSVARQVNAEVLFSFDSAQLTVAGKQQLDELIRQMKNSKIDQVVITGHTDPIGTNSYNMRLSSMRAQAVQQYLSGSIASELIQTNAKGESTLKVTSCGDKNNAKSIACNAPNRRVEVLSNIRETK